MLSRMSERPIASHHAVLLVGPHDLCLASIPEEHRTGVDAEHIVVDVLSIEMARSLRERAASRPIESEARRFFISCRQILPPAQNALLKVFEDPPATARFYLIVPRASVLMGTVRSRMALSFVAPADAYAPSPTTTEFLKASYAERFNTIAALHKAKDTAALRTLIAEIERAYAGGERDAAVLRDILMASSYGDAAGASPKMLLEHLALSLPQR